MRSIAELRKMTVAELDRELSHPNTEFDGRGRQIVQDEINRRLLEEIKRPHWTLTPNFWIALVAAVAASIAAFPVVKDWFSGPPKQILAPANQPSVDKSAKSQPLLSPSQAGLPARDKK